MTSLEKTKFIESRIGMGYTVRQIQHALKIKFDSGVKNSVIGEIKEEIAIEKEKKGNKTGNTGNKEGNKKDTPPPNNPPPPNKNKKKIPAPTDISITKAELWEAIISDNDLRGLKTWFTIKPDQTKRNRKGLGDLVIVINELIKIKIKEENKHGKNN